MGFKRGDMPHILMKLDGGGGRVCDHGAGIRGRSAIARTREIAFEGVV